LGKYIGDANEKKIGASKIGIILPYHRSNLDFYTEVNAEQIPFRL